MLRCFSVQFELRHKLRCTNFPGKGIADVNYLLAGRCFYKVKIENRYKSACLNALLRLDF